MSADLVRDLRRLGDDLPWPETPDLAAAVDARLEADRVRRPARRRRRPRRLLVAVALALLVPAGGAFAFPQARDDVLEWLGLKSVEVRRVPELPAGARPAPPNALGDSVTREEAARRAGFDPVLPPRLGSPRELRERDGVVTVVYGGGLRLAQLPGAVDHALLSKLVTVTNEVRGVPEGIFITGRHAYAYRLPSGDIMQARTTGTTLIVQRGDLLLRLEGIRTYEQGRRLLAP